VPLSLLTWRTFIIINVEYYGNANYILFIVFAWSGFLFVILCGVVVLNRLNDFMKKQRIISRFRIL
jgi:hypothetical protein